MALQWVLQGESAPEITAADLPDYIGRLLPYLGSKKEVDALIAHFNALSNAKRPRQVVKASQHIGLALGKAVGAMKKSNLKDAALVVALHAHVIQQILDHDRRGAVVAEAALKAFNSAFEKGLKERTLLSPSPAPGTPRLGLSPQRMRLVVSLALMVLTTLSCSIFAPEAGPYAPFASPDSNSSQAGPWIMIGLVIFGVGLYALYLLEPFGQLLLALIKGRLEDRKSFERGITDRKFAERAGSWVFKSIALMGKKRISPQILLSEINDLTSRGLPKYLVWEGYVKSCVDALGAQKDTKTLQSILDNLPPSLGEPDEIMGDIRVVEVVNEMVADLSYSAIERGWVENPHYIPAVNKSAELATYIQRAITRVENSTVAGGSARSDFGYWFRDAWKETPKAFLIGLGFMIATTIAGNAVGLYAFSWLAVPIAFLSFHLGNPDMFRSRDMWGLAGEKTIAAFFLSLAAVFGISPLGIGFAAAGIIGAGLTTLKHRRLQSATPSPSMTENTPKAQAQWLAFILYQIRAGNNSVLERPETMQRLSELLPKLPSMVGTILDVPQNATWDAAQDDEFRKAFQQAMTVLFGKNKDEAQIQRLAYQAMLLSAANRTTPRSANSGAPTIVRDLVILVGDTHGITMDDLKTYIKGKIMSAGQDVKTIILISDNQAADNLVKAVLPSLAIVTPTGANIRTYVNQQIIQKAAGSKSARLSVLDEFLDKILFAGKDNVGTSLALALPSDITPDPSGLSENSPLAQATLLWIPIITHTQEVLHLWEAAKLIAAMA